MREQATDAERPQRMGAILPAVELYESTNREAGWDCDLTQMSTGPLDARFFHTSSDEINFVTESFNQQLHLRYSPPAGMVSFAIPVATDGDSKLFGHKLYPDDLISFGVESELDFLSARRTDSLSVFMPEKRFQELAERLQPDGTKILQRGEGSVKQCTKGALASLWREANEMLLGNTSAAVEAELLPNLAAALVLLASDNKGEVFSSRVHVHRSLERAKDYIHSHLASAIRLEDVCRYAGLGMRSLQYHFAHQYQTTPTRYILWHRMNLARRRLVAACPAETTVTRVALECGLTHLGRFSTRYRLIFAESPHKTLACKS